MARIEPISLALLEIDHLSPTLIVADACSKSATVHIVGVESTFGAAQCIKLAGPTADVIHSAETGRAVARRMGSDATIAILPAPETPTHGLMTASPVYSPMLGLYDDRIPKENCMGTADALGLLETQGLVAALHATDDMLKASNVMLVGKEKIGAAYVTIIVRGDVAAVQTAIDTAKATVDRLGGTLIMADVIPRPHAELAALLPAAVS